MDAAEAQATCLAGAVDYTDEIFDVDVQDALAAFRTLTLNRHMPPICGLSRVELPWITRLHNLQRQIADVAAIGGGLCDNAQVDLNPRITR